MFDNSRIAVTIPVFNEESHIKDVIEAIPNYVDYIIVVDDCSSDNSFKQLLNINDSRLFILRHKKNKGVGKSTIDGYLFGIFLGADILVRIDGDGQMNPKLIKEFIKPIINENYDFTKGNRLYSKKHRMQMPKLRLIGNLILTWMTKIISGNYTIMDSQNGFIAIKAECFRKLHLGKLRYGYVFENSVLFQLSLINARIKDIPMKAKYGDEISHIKLYKFIPAMIIFFFESFFYKVMLRIKSFFGKNNLKKQEIFLDFSEFDNIVFSSSYENFFINSPFTPYTNYARDEKENKIRLSSNNFLP